MSRFLDPKNDYVFWKVFGTEKNKDVLISFLNHVLCFEGRDQITEIEFIDPKQRPEISAYRESIIDVLCKDQNNVQIIVEMQISRHPGFEKRAQYYAAKAYSRQIIKEDENHKKMQVYAKLKGVIFLAIADFIMFPEKSYWKSEHRLLDTKTYVNDLKDFYFIFLELPKFNKHLDQLQTLQEKWAYFFKHAHHSTLSQMENLTGKDVIIKRAFEAIDQASWSEEELNTYDKLIKTQMDNLVVEQYKLSEAEKRGRQEEKLKIAKEMLADGDLPDKVARITGLTLDQIKELL